MILRPGDKTNLFPFLQVLALNRGEQNKILTVKLTIPKHVENQFLAHLHKTWVPSDSTGSVNYFLCTCKGGG